MIQDSTQEQFLELVRAGLFPGKAARILVHGSTVDWGEIYLLAEEQSVIGLIAAGLEVLPPAERPPQEVLLQIIGSALQIEQQNNELNAYLTKLVGLLRQKDVYAILVKGQGIAQCYEKPLWRASGDIDLLLSDTNYDNAKKVLTPLAVSADKEYTSFKHLGMTMDGGFVVELHGTMHSRLTKRIDKVINEAQRDVFFGGNVRSWDNDGTTVFLPAPDSDVIFVFTHILRHFFFEGIGLRQICDWCRLLWTYRSVIDVRLLEKRLREAGLMSEWRAFAAFAVEYLGMPVEAMPLYSADKRWRRKAAKICADILKVGNFGHKQRRDFSGMNYLWRKFVSVWGRLSDMLRHFSIFPKDSVVFFGGVLRTGLYAAVRGE